MRAALAALLLLAADPAPAPPPDLETTRPLLKGMPGESASHFLARIVVDACTSEETDEALIWRAELLLAACHDGYQSCIRRVCVRIGEPPQKARVF